MVYLFHLTSKELNYDINEIYRTEELALERMKNELNILVAPDAIDHLGYTVEQALEREEWEDKNYIMYVDELPVLGQVIEEDD